MCSIPCQRSIAVSRPSSDDRSIGLQGLDQAALARAVVPDKDREGRQLDGSASPHRLEVLERDQGLKTERVGHFTQPPLDVAIGILGGDLHRVGDDGER